MLSAVVVVVVVRKIEVTLAEENAISSTQIRSTIPVVASRGKRGWQIIKKSHW